MPHQTIIASVEVSAVGDLDFGPCASRTTGTANRQKSPCPVSYPGRKVHFAKYQTTQGSPLFEYRVARRKQSARVGPILAMAEPG